MSTVTQPLGRMSRRVRTLTVGVTLFVVLLVLAFTLPVPYVILSPGPTLNTLGKDDQGNDIIVIKGHETRSSTGHLNLTTDAFLLAWSAAEVKPAAKTDGKSRQYGLLERSMLRWMEPPYRIKSRTQATFRPGEADSWEATIERFWTGQERVLLATVTAQDFDLNANKVRSPFAAWLRYPLGFSFDAFAAHERRHQWQARQIVDSLK